MIYFVGAGPGDPELLTIRGKNALESADVVIYAGSLVPRSTLKYAKKTAKLYDSSKLSLEEITALMLKAEKEGKAVVRIHSGDPSIYGALREQIEILENHGVGYKVIPGVSSFLAAAASLGVEYTIPEISQTLIITRMGERTTVPKKEALRKLALHGASMCIFLSVHLIDKVVQELRSSYASATPVAVVSRVSREDEKIVFGSLKDIAEKVKKAKVEKTALILVGDFLKSRGKKSKLYDRKFSHSYRRGK